jgi:hypothetical protein
VVDGKKSPVLTTMVSRILVAIPRDKANITPVYAVEYSIELARLMRSRGNENYGT